MKTSVVIPCFNAEDTLGEQLTALAEQQWPEPWEVLLVDNRSTDESMSVAKQFQNELPNLRIVDAHERQGQPYAVNVGVRAAKGENVLFCDADDVVGKKYVSAMSEALVDHQFVACGIEETKLNELWIQTSHANLQKENLSRYTYPPFLSHSGGGVMGVKRHLFEKFGGFDEALPILHDTDFCWRLQLAGVPLVFVKDTMVHVRYRDTLQGLYRQSRNYAEFNVLLYKLYRERGMPGISSDLRRQRWSSVMRDLRYLRTAAGRAYVAWQLGWCVGRIRGSLKHRIWGL
jgi:GT2 family glycosyltransferase